MPSTGVATATTTKPLRRKITFVLIAVALVGLWFLFRQYNPYEHNFFPKCPIYSVTGYQCPGCGAQRAMHFLSNAQLEKALHENFLLVVSIPYLLFGFIVEYLPTSKFRGDDPQALLRLDGSLDRLWPDHRLVGVAECDLRTGIFFLAFGLLRNGGHGNPKRTAFRIAKPRKTEVKFRKCHFRWGHFRKTPLCKGGRGTSNLRLPPPKPSPGGGFNFRRPSFDLATWG